MRGMFRSLDTIRHLALHLLYILFILRNTNNSNARQQDSLAFSQLLNTSERLDTMTNIINALINDEAGFIISAELVLVSTIAVLGMIVGLSGVALNVNNELEDVGSAIGSMNQTYCVKGVKGHQGSASGTEFRDNIDHCDNTCDVQGFDGRGEYSE